MKTKWKSGSFFAENWSFSKERVQWANFWLKIQDQRWKLNWIVQEFSSFVKVGHFWSVSLIEIFARILKMKVFKADIFCLEIPYESHINNFGKFYLEEKSSMSWKSYNHEHGSARAKYDTSNWREFDRKCQ